VFSRQFLYWALVRSKKAKALLEWSRDTLTPDEHYWLMLDALEEAPGKSAGEISWKTITPYIVWKANNHNCSGNVYNKRPTTKYLIHRYFINTLLNNLEILQVNTRNYLY